MNGCGHDDVVLPDPLPDAIIAALAVRTAPAIGLDQRRVIEHVALAVALIRLAGPATGRPPAPATGWDAPALCAILRRHPDVAAKLTPGGPLDDRLCRQAGELLSPSALPPRTELGLAERVAAYCGADMGWSVDGTFRIWRGTRWETDESGAMAVEQVKVVVRRVLSREVRWWTAIAAHTAKQDTTGKSLESKAAAKTAAAAAAFEQRAQAARTMTATLALLRGEPAVLVPAERWDGDDRLLTTPDGTIELGDGGAKLREHRRGDHITATTRACWRPRADAGPWNEFLRQVLPDEKVRAYLQRLAGYVLLGGNPARVLLMLVGPTSSGKSTFVEAIAYALGEYAAPFRLSLFVGEREGGRARPDLHAALGRRLIYTTEASERWKLDADQVKRLTGNDSDAARTVYSGVYRERQPAFVPLIATNAAPAIRGADAALFRRLRAVPFAVSIPAEAEDNALGARLREHADAVLTWLIEGFDSYSALGGFGPIPDACATAVREIRADLSLIDRWLDERCETGPDYVTAVSALADDWAAWCVTNRVDRVDRVNSIALGKELAGRGFAAARKKIDGRSVRARSGLRLVADEAPADGSSTSDDEHLPGCTCLRCLR